GAWGSTDPAHRHRWGGAAYALGVARSPRGVRAWRTVISSPFDPHAASPLELQDRLRADARGEPYLLYRDGDGAQRIVELADDRERLTVGRSEETDVPLSWDGEVSRVHAALERLADGWT